jgi:hypothetical protein
MKSNLIQIINNLRKREIFIYDEKILKLDEQFNFLKVYYQDFLFLHAVITKGDGNCFYNSIS